MLMIKASSFDNLNMFWSSFSLNNWIEVSISELLFKFKPCQKFSFTFSVFVIYSNNTLEPCYSEGAK